MSQISLVVVDGQYTFADALSACLGAEEGLRVVAAAESAATTRRLLIGRDVDVVLLDSELPESLQFAAELARLRPGQQPIRVIMLGSVPEAAHIVAALRAGVAGWVPKDGPVEHLLNAIQCAMSDETWLPPMAMGPVLRLLLHQSHQPQASPNHPLANLTPREREVLSYLADGVGRREVAERMHLSANTVRSHLQNLMGKLKVHSTLEAVAIARQVQYSEARSGTAS
jgi:DNA-binding NarL/FixJ family response regulator